MGSSKMNQKMFESQTLLSYWAVGGTLQFFVSKVIAGLPKLDLFKFFQYIDRIVIKTNFMQHY